MVRKRIIVKGNVQGAGYRALVTVIARSLGLKGQVRNLDDGTVEIFCEAEEGLLERFLSKINIKHPNGYLLAIDVRVMVEHSEGTDGYNEGKTPEKFGSFEVAYGQYLRYAEKEMLQRQELMIYGGSQVLDGLAVVGEKVDVVGQNVQAMHGDMNERFDKLDEKYALIGDSLIETNKNLGRMNENIKNLVETTSENNAKTNENIKNLVETTSENNAKSNENIAQMNEVLISHTDALTKLVNAFVERKAKG